jgi:hypothetical protein
MLAFFLRGGKLHNFLVLTSERVFQDAGFLTDQESPKRLPDGKLDFIDLIVRRDRILIAIEVETSARNVVSNARKAEQLDSLLWVVVPSRKVQKAVQEKLSKQGIQPAGEPIRVLLLAQLQQEVMKCLPLFSTVYERKGIQKNKSGEENNAG